MLVKVNSKSQIDIPGELVDQLGLSEGDKLDISETDGIISIIPVSNYPKKHLDERREEIKQTKTKIAYGEQPVFDNVEALFAKLEEN